MNPKILERTKREWEAMFNMRLPSGQKLLSHLSKSGERPLSVPDRKFLVGLLRPSLSKVTGAQKQALGLLSGPCSNILRFTKVWRAVDSCLTLAFGKETKATTCYKVKWWVRLCRLVTKHNSTHFACKEWKDYCKYLYLFFGGAVSHIPLWNCEWPGHPEGTWLVKPAGTLMREEYARWHLLTCTRLLPSGDSVTVSKSLEDHEAALCDAPEPSDEDLEKLRVYSVNAALSVKSYVRASLWDRTSGHISISNSACYEYSRSKGGRRQFVLDHLKDWLDEQPLSDRTIILPTGESVFEKAGIERRLTVHPPMMSAGVLNPAKTDTGLLTEDFQDSEQQRVGFQLLAWSFAYLMDNGFVDEFGYPTGKPLPVQRETIPEPGNKVRIATKSLAAYITYGQPFGHIFREVLSEDPSLRAGLSGGYQAYEWLKKLESTGSQTTPPFIMVGDFEAATDHIHHKAGRVAMHALADSLGVSCDYVRGYIDLLLSPRIFLNESGHWVTSRAGCLMGEPGTKIVLTFLAKVANVYAHNGVSSPYFATAGDDQIDADDDCSVLLRYAEASRITTMIPSLDKWAVMSNAVNYCQQGLYCGKSKAEAEICVPKARLVSPEQKAGRGDEDLNPSFGKARLLAKEIAWCEFPEIAQQLVCLFLRNMAQYVSFSHELFTPTEWGGLGLPGLTVKSLEPLLPERKRQAILRRESGDYEASKVLARWSSSRNFERGIIVDEFSAEEAYYDLLTNFLDTVTGPAELGIDSPSNLRFKDVVKLMADNGYEPIDHVIRTLISSQKYQHFWQPESRPERGYKSLSWAERSKRMQSSFAKLARPISSSFLPPDGPRWRPTRFVRTVGLFKLESQTGEHADPSFEDGLIRETLLPLLGNASTGPRVFLHYSNARMLRHASRSQRH